MKYLTAILIICATLYSQDSPAIWWGKTDSNQKDRAGLIYEYGFRFGDRGHTAVALGWTETSLGADTTHDEDSQKDFGLSEIALLDIGCSSATYDSLESGFISLERQTFLALDYWTLCYDRLRESGYSPAKAYFWAYPKYSTGSNYLRFRRRGEVFRQRVNFLKTKFKRGE